MNHTRVDADTNTGIGRITIDRPDRSNAIDTQTITEISDGYRALDRNPDIRVIVFSGAGRGFCSGHDLSLKPDGQQKSVLEDLDVLRKENNLLLELWGGDTPIIASVHGYCLGAAVELVMLCDLAVAANDCRFSHPAIRGAAGSPNMLIYPFRLGFAKAKEYLWVTPELLGEQAAEWDLVNRAVPREELDAAVNLWAKRIASMPKDNIRLMRRGLRRLADHAGFREAIELGADFDALGHTGPATAKWREAVATLGLKEAVRRRDENFR